jgi:hypothetical protein
VLSGRGLSVVSVVCCQVEVSASGRSLVQSSSTSGVCGCVCVVCGSAWCICGCACVCGVCVGVCMGVVCFIVLRCSSNLLHLQ